MPPRRNVIVIGLDGLEPTIVDRLLHRGELPALSALRERGGYARVRTTTPAQTPVAWSTFATGLNPGRHGIFDFLRRNPQTYLPELGLTRYEQKNAFVPPRAVNQRRGRTIWEYLSDADIPSVVLRCPCMYPPQPIKGRILCGMGVPDVRGGLGTPTFFTTDATSQPRESENVARLEPAGNGQFTGHLPGPHNPRKSAPFTCAVSVTANLAARTLTVSIAGSGQTLIIPEGQWSDWAAVQFKVGLLQSIRGIVRFFACCASAQPELYASPVNFAPSSPMFPISAPDSFAADLERDLGPYYTTGMVEDHTGFGNDRLDEASFLVQCEDAYAEREAMLMHELSRRDAGLLFCLFDTPDRIQHMFWRYGEPDHPANAGRTNGYAHVIEEHYRRCDATVGRVLAHADNDTLVIVLSDHGFGTFRRGVNLNSWLREQGLLSYRDDAEHDAGAEFFHNVDWSRTKAYAVGLGGIYLNQRGREREGTVSDEEAPQLQRQIADALGGLPDAAQHQVAVRRVRTRDEVYSGEHAADAPDLLVDFNRGYRASWGTALGGAPRDVFEDNARAWAGDHIVDPELVPGVLFMNQPFHGEGARLLDMAPTILAALGVPPAPAFEGTSLLS